jgi:hypothetical protein
MYSRETVSATTTRSRGLTPMGYYCYTSFSFSFSDRRQTTCQSLSKYVVVGERTKLRKCSKRLSWVNRLCISVLMWRPLSVCSYACACRTPLYWHKHIREKIRSDMTLE